MDADSKYLRIGTTYFRSTEKPGIDGQASRTLIKWKLSTIKQDEKDLDVALIPKYIGFCTVPSHTDYKRSINEYYNLYEPISHVPKRGDFKHIIQLVEHVFEEQYELGMDYLQLLYLQPLQKLPILLLVSQERNTGKTTFLNFLKAVFQHNVTFNTNEAFRSQFNADWAGKLLVMVDEVLLNRREDTERLKNLSTALSYKMEAKGKDREEMEFFAKFILCSNNESFPIAIDREETRFWVRRVRPLVSDDPDFLCRLKEEIPAFLDHLKHRSLSTRRSTRMWFSPEELHTEALDRIIRSSRDRSETVLAEMLQDFMAMQDLERMSFCMKDLLPLLRCNELKMDESQLRRILNEKWRLPHAQNGLSYTTWHIERTSPLTYSEHSAIGRFYTVTAEFLKTIC